MNLAELLLYVGSEYLDDRADLVDGDPDELWSDTTIVRHLNQAQRILARRSWCIIDTGHPQAGVITLQTGKTLYPLHESVLRAYYAIPSDQTWILARTDDEDIQSFRPVDDTWWWPQIDPTVDTPGRPIAVATDAGSRMIRIFHTPSATESGLKLSLKVARLPVTWLTLDDTSAEPETPRDYDMDLADYAVGKCLTMPTVDSDAKKEGHDLLAAFSLACLEARHDRQRAERGSSRWAFSSTTSVIR